MRCNTPKGRLIAFWRQVRHAAIESHDAASAACCSSLTSTVMFMSSSLAMNTELPACEQIVKGAD